jgi:general L-amino acid transport system permease protein
MTDTFHRTEMLPAQLPPVTERGLVKWMRENLFATPLNGVLTLLAVFVVFVLIRWLYPWFANSVWNASSLQECRQIIIAAVGEGATGACWALIKERWHQFIFGFYPQDLYWRPTLAFVLLFVALAPVLFSQVPRKLFWFTVLYPAIAFFLIWGGSVWLPITVVLGLGLVGFTFALISARSGMIAGGVTALILFLIIFLDPLSALLHLMAVVLGWFSAEPVSLWVGFTVGGEVWDFRNLFPLFPHLTGWLEGHMPWALRSVDSDEVGGFMLAIIIGVTAISFSLPLGILLALGRQSDMPIVKTICVGFIEFVRGVPLITLLFTASLILGYFLPVGVTFDVILRVMILVTFFAAAYLAEVIRGGLAALPRGQYEAADALGLDYWRAQRLIILPQALKISIPGIVSTFIGLFKDTTLVSFVALLEPLRGVTTAVRADTDWQGIYWEPYIFVGAIFFVICFGMSRYSMYLENKLKTDHR